MTTETREGLCELCGEEYEVWSAPNPLWNKVMRGGDPAAADRHQFLCFECFTKWVPTRENSMATPEPDADEERDDG